MFLNKVMQETRKICTTENGPIWATPENLPFLKMKFINFFLIPMDQKYQNESAPIFCYAKSRKYCLKLLIIAVLQPPDWIQRKKNTLYFVWILRLTLPLPSYSGFAETYIGRTIKSIANSFNTKFELQQVKYYILDYVVLVLVS